MLLKVIMKKYFQIYTKIFKYLIITLIVFSILYYFIYENKNDNKVTELQENSEIVQKHNCNLKELKNIPKKSVVIAGHVYSWDKTTLFNIELMKLLNENNKNIELVILNGDVLHVPSLDKWRAVDNFMDKLQLDYIVVPGNHDVEFGDNSLRDIFKISFNQKFPLNLNDSIISDYKISAYDSTENYGKINLKSLNIEKKNIIIQHHSPIIELDEIANSLQNLKLIEFDELSKKFIEETIFIVGDFGIHTSFLCIEKNNLKIIGSGLGKDNEEILIFSNDELYRYLF